MLFPKKARKGRSGRFRRFRFRFRFREKRFSELLTVPVSGSGSVPEPPCLRCLVCGACEVRDARRSGWAALMTSAKRTPLLSVSFCRRLRSSLSCVPSQAHSTTTGDHYSQRTQPYYLEDRNLLKLRSLDSSCP